jgi:predicted O-linked N-acetylglucosamine transferase (SPINDLY family)
MTPDADATFAAALAHHEAGRLDAALIGYRDTLARDPDHAESLHLLGLITAQNGDPAGGASLIERAIGLAPGRAPHHNSLALAWHRLGQFADAVREYRAAAALRPGSAEIHNNLATTLRVLGQHEAAVIEYRRAASLAPDIAEIWYNLADTLAELGAVAEVEACFRRAVGLRPEYVDALANYGRWLTARARWIEGEVWLLEAVRLAPGDARAWNNLGVARQELGRGPEAEADYRRAIALDPGFADAHYNLGCLLFGEGRSEEAVACHTAALAADRLHGAARLAVCMARLPILYHTEAEVADRRAAYLAALRELAEAVAAPDVARAVAAAIGTSQPFFLPYQGRNDRAPQADYGRLACRLLAATAPPPSLAPRPNPGERIRLGVVSGFFQDHTIFRLFLDGWLTQFDRDRFEVTAFHTGRMSDADTARAAGLCDRFVHGLASAGSWRQAVSEAAPHALLYPEIGIDPVCGRLAAQRLARVQCVAWGQPETTGMPTLDYFLSADLMEPADGDAHYTEHLVRLPGLGLHYTPDERAVPSLDRAALGLDQTALVYWSGQALYKYLPEYDAVFPRIAAAVGHCQFVFIGYARSAAVTVAFRERLGRAFAAFGLDADLHCVILPPLSQERFVAAVGLADVVLDTPGWSGGRSTLDCLASNPAIVTLPGPLMRGRHTTAILRQIGCEATIARSLDDYVTTAARLGRDAAWRARVRQAVTDGKSRAFRDARPVRALEAFLARAVEGS